ncbi:CCA tRNA nucleotidyltransferase, mitochondrial [Pleosporales sp. CAS-2024a]
MRPPRTLPSPRLLACIPKQPWAAPSFANTRHYMAKRHPSPRLQERTAKRRESGLPGLQPYATMTSTAGPRVQLELTEVEARLRQLLLDVAAYVDDAPSAKHMSGVEVPEDLAQQSTTLRWTGGWVRDKLLNLESHDIDLAINNMTGEHFGLKMQEYLSIPGNAEKHGLLSTADNANAHDRSKKIAPGLHKIEANPEKSKNLETATTKIMGLDLDLVNLRKETYNELSRNPEMEFGTAEEDALRRDATVNALFYNLHTCQVEDFTRQGFDDMAAKIIRTPLEPTQTFKDDPLRILRLIRFASRLDYVIEPQTAEAMANAEIQHVLKVKISRERVGIELEKMLKGPRPRMALHLIDRFGLYSTVFTDPTRELPSKPETALFLPSYDFVESVLECRNGIPTLIKDTLFRDADDKYLGWICATMMPWANAPTVPHTKPTQKPFFVAYLVAREGFKAPNRICDVIAASMAHGEEIRSMVAQCTKRLRRPDLASPTEDPTGRDVLGMALRRWGSTWRSQVFFNMVYEVVLQESSQESIVHSYAVFLEQLSKHKILDVDTFKPLLKGTDVAKALGTKPGPWMKDALDVVMAWQLRNPESTDADAAIEAVRISRDHQTESELPSRLASHFLELTIPPLFAQNEANLNALEKSRRHAPWKDPGAHYVLDLLQWSIGALSWKEKERKWHLLAAPILRMIDDTDTVWKARGIHMLGVLLMALQPLTTSTEHASNRDGGRNGTAEFLRRTGYHDVFSEALFPLFAYIPSLTPEPEAVILFKELFPTLTALGLLLPSDIDEEQGRSRLFDKMMREGVLGPLSHLSTAWAYPDLATVIINHMRRLVEHLGIDSVKHMAYIIPCLSTILQEAFVVSHEAMVISTLGALQAVLQNAWPRIPRYRAEIMMGLCLCWQRCMEGEAAIAIQDQLQETVAMLDAVLQAVDDGDGLAETWLQEKLGVMQANPDYKALFERCGEQA